MTDTMKKLAVGTFAALALCLALLPGVAWADVDPGVTLAKVDGEDAVSVTLVAPNAPRDNVRTLSLTLLVTGVDPNETTASFVFDGSLDGVSVKEARMVKGETSYQVKLYVAGIMDLYAADQLTLGKLVFAGADVAMAVVSVDEDGLQVVNAAHHSETPEVQAASVELGKTPDTPETPDTPDNPDTPSTGDDNKGEGDHNNTGNSNNNGNNTNDTSGSNPNANRSPGAPSGTDNSPVPTGDNLTGIVIALAASLAVAAVVLVIIFVRRSRNH